MNTPPLCPWKLLGWFKPGLVPPVGQLDYDAGSHTIKPEPITGMKAICTLVNRSKATVMDWITKQNFPAFKINGEWKADRSQVLDWLNKEIWKCD